jgi:YVTN family beta-propeller protein
VIKSIRRIVVRATDLRFACAVLTACMFETGIQYAPAALTGDSLQVVGTVTVGKLPEALAITPNGAYLYVGNYGSSTLSVINTSLNTVSAKIALPSGPRGIAITPDGKTAFLLSGKGISVIRMSTNKVLKTISPGPSFGTGLAVTPDGTQLFVSNFYGTVSIINIVTDKIEKKLTVGYNANAVAISPDGKYAYVDANAAGGPFYLTKIDIASKTIIVPQLGAGVFTSGISGALVFSPDSQTVYVPEGENNVLAVNAVTGQVEFEVVLSTQPQFFLGGAQISPSGEFLYVAESTTNSVATIDTLQGMTVGTPLAVGSAPDAVAISPSGSYLYVGNSTPGNRRTRGTVSVIQITP